MILSDQYIVNGPGVAASAMPYSATSPVTPSAPALEYSPKSRTVAAVLTWLFGSLGVGNFYLGMPGRGLAKILLSLTGWAVAVGGFFYMMTTQNEADNRYSVSGYSGGSGYTLEIVEYNFGDVVPMFLGIVIVAVVGSWQAAEFFLIIGRNGSYGVDREGRPLR